GAVQAVLAAAGVPRAVVHHHLGDPRALPAGVDGDEAVHLAVQLHVPEHVAAVGLERAAVVVEAHPADHPDQPVRDPGGELAPELLVLAVPAPSAHHVVPFAEPCEQPGDVGRIILEISVHRTMTAPRAASMPADMAAVWPKFRRKRMTRSAG